MRVVDIEPHQVIVEPRQTRPLGDIDALIASIEDVGLLHPIVVGTDHKLKVGYRRLEAFKRMDRDTIPAHLTDDLNDVIRALKAERDENVQREDLPPTVMVERARELEAQEREAARVRQGANQISGKLPEIETGNTRDKVGDAFGVSGKTYEHAKAVVEAAEADPETYGDLPNLMDEKSVHRAHRELIKRQRQDTAPPLPSDKYRVWYADPPWQYNDSGIIDEAIDNYGRAERHYPTMALTEICAMGSAIKDRCLSDAVLFLWTTSPFLEDAFKVIAAWGFQYKTSFVWDKVRHNYGHYNSVRHEFLLVCTRGSCTPDVQKLFDSVQVIEKTDKHSEKPEQFREIIDTLYTTGKRIELFARKEHDGWDTWGNEPGR